ncbi:hypothetical protein L6164_013832 [Bauhinia variegata]|uniref:Uncharacterized protein n=1 Tax=Bauhinia variegata TaxID=167791 RepID=A0ACB9NJ27_BAUVA|nr:hypothetical protein L6164_013832 [Bauhinia variegata]
MSFNAQTAISIMNLTSNYNFTDSPNTHLRKLPFLSSKPYQVREFRVYRRRRLKTSRQISVGNQIRSLAGTPFENLFNSLITQYPYVHSFDLIAPALGFASGAAVYLSRFKPWKNSGVLDIGEWILFASPTPFNRFVFLRCPSISFDGSELLEDVNKKLVKEERHFVTLNSGRIQVRSHGSGGRDVEGGNLTYQRVCVTAKDGGVVSLDWPANLDLEEERGLDTTLFLVPGTPEGSMDKNIRSFVLEALKRGFFPVVMNPRGCAGSPLTTARLFTAADSDDVCTAISYIKTARPWTTFMGVGWGYGANMLTKYLAEVGERTPLTAATCTDNPFDLDEATRSSPYHIVNDQKLTSGLVDILRSNQKLFQGKTKGFDVENGLSAKSVRDFEKSISMVSYGFESIEDFYSKSSTRNVIGGVKIPVLFIQNDGGTAPVFSIPRNLIAENPFTSLLLCSCVPSSFMDADRSTMSWCQLLTIEWLTAVELGLLKGRHPLLTDIDVTINPSKGLAIIEDIRPDKTNEDSKLLDLTRSDAFDGYSIDPPKNMLQDSKNGASFQFRSEEDLQRNLDLQDTSLQIQNGPLQQISSTNPDVTEEENASSIDGEHGQVLQTAQVVMNMLDVTMPGTLTEEKKKKVLTAVGQGETLLQALQDAVPEDVRGKLTAAVTGIMHAQGSQLKFNKVLGIDKAPDAISGQKNQEKMKGVSGAEGTSEDQSSLNGLKKTKDGNDNAPSGTGVPAVGTESEVLPLDKSQKAMNLAQSEATNNDEVDSSRKETSESRSNDMNEQSKEKAGPDLGNSEKGLENVAKHTPSQHEGTGDVLEAGSVDEQKSQNSGIAQTDTKEENNIQKVAQKTEESCPDQRTQETSSDQSKMASTTTKEEPPSPPVSSEHQTVEMEGNGHEKKENKNVQQISDQANSVSSDSSPAPFSVSQALDALTGMDDSTQVAVNNVFSVIESMIDQFEESSDSESEVKDGKEIQQELGEKQKTDNQITESNTIDEPFVDNHNHGTYPQDDTCYMEEEPTSLNTVNGSCVSNPQGTNSDDHMAPSESKINDQLVGERILADKWDGHGHMNRKPLHVSASPYGYLISKIPNNSLDLDTTTALLLDYIPEEGEWKLLEQPQNMGSYSNIVTCEDTGCKKGDHSTAKSSDKEQYIEPAYVILDTEKQPEPVKEFISTDTKNENIDASDDGSEELIRFVKKIILDSLKVEVGRKLNAAETQQMKLKLAGDMEHVANSISLAIAHSKLPVYTGSQFHNIEGSEEHCYTIDGEHIVAVISSAVQETSYLKRVMPVGVIVGSSLAALKKYFNVSTMQDNGQGGSLTHADETKPGKKNYGNVREIDHAATVQDNSQGGSLIHDDEKKPGKKNYGNVGEIDQVPDKKSSLGHSVKSEEIKSESKDVNKNTVMVGAVTAVLGASALLMQQQDPHKANGTDENSSLSMKMKYNHRRESHKLEEIVPEKHQNNIVTSLAEKAMSVASPVVPTTEDGAVDQDRLVAMLADLGQRGGLLRLVGKMALLWGGIRGAMSLTDRLISFLRIAERPLFQRIFGFVGMVLVLWSPVAVPLLPTLVQSWTTHTPSRIAELACIIGLYTAIMILVMLWGKRIRGYKNSLEQYGLDMTSPKILDFFMGLAGGIMLVFSIQAVNVSLGCACFSWPPLAPSLDAMTWLRVHGQMVMLVAQGTVMATAIALVEELLFRSWLPQEIAVDVGYHRGIIISGLAFSLFQRSLQSIPALWILSLVLSGARQRNGGSLSLPIGLRTGMLASSFILQKGGFLIYNKKFPPWITGTHPFEPFSGIVGLLFSLTLALLLYPRQTSQKQEIQE